ncbi:uncharacterized protein LOC123307883 isoform X3 [Coccinella septempunctata]|uniref:uncharacterized protein LOC123307883 isoform X3 n=1 Tax=Coccinella septempunctata TaxID=41139 RepID=UPI001D0949D2|nr:uncharacterized protein LOC123307883 isoform X3 [Coccinella septempunctata]
MGCTVGSVLRRDSLLEHIYQEDEDTWISGEELKTEGSSGSDDDVPRRKITPRKSRRRRSEGYTPPESRLSLPNLGDNKAGIAFRVSRPDDNDGKGERFSVGGELCAEEERMRMEAAMSRMSTRSSLDRTEEAGDFARCESDWRPKRGSLKLPNLEEETEKTKVIRFSDDIEKFDPPDHRVEVNGFNFEVGAGDEISVEEGDSLKADFDKWKESSMGFSDIPYEDALDEDDIDRYVLKASDSENWKPLLKSKLNLPNFDGDNVETREKRNGVNETRKKNRRNMDDKNFIERNIELAKVGMNFSLSDEQKQRLEKILMDEITDEPANDDNRIPSGVRRANQMPNEQNNNGDEVYSNCTINAYRLSDEHKEKLIGIDSALKAYEEDDSRRAGGSGIGVGLVKSLKEIDEKLKSLSTSYIHDEQLLEKNRKKSTGIDIQRLEENVVQNLGLKTSTDLTISTELSI